jgi:hypothetical protein
MEVTLDILKIVVCDRLKLMRTFRAQSADLTTFLIIPIISALLLYKNIPIANKNALSVVSVTALVNLFLWILFIVQISLNFALLKNNKYHRVLLFNLYFILTSLLTFKILIKALSLKGTPLPGSDIRGDLLTIYQITLNAKNDFFSGGGYPPAWPTIIGNIANFLNANVLSLFKPAEILLLAIAPFLTYLSWRLVFERWISLVIVIFQTIITNYDYKNLVLNIIIPVIISLFMRNLDKNISERMSRFQNLKSGILIGLVSLFYYGHLYWFIPFFVFTIFISYFSNQRTRLIEAQNYIYLGLAFGITPAIYFNISTNILYTYGLLIFAIVVFEVVKNIKSKYLYQSLNLTTNLLILISLILAFFTMRTGDTWVEGGVERDNPTTGAIFQLLGVNAFIFIGFIIALYLIIKKYMFVIPIFTLGGMHLSSTFFMYLIASEMQSSKQINLWPRSTEVQEYSMSLIILIICIAIIKILIEKYQVKQSLFEDKSRSLAFIGAVLFFFYSFFINNLGSQMHGSMPIHSFNGAWFAHQGCSNPHEDPMLSKVFENFPEIQNFLRDNCSSANWPIIPPLK